MTEYITTGKASKLLGISYDAIRKKCIKGRVPGAFQTEDGRGWWMIPREWVDGILSSIRPIRRRRNEK